MSGATIPGRRGPVACAAALLERDREPQADDSRSVKVEGAVGKQKTDLGCGALARSRLNAAVFGANEPAHLAVSER